MPVPQPFGVRQPPDYTQIESYEFKRWLNSIYLWSSTVVNLVTVTTTYTVAALVYYVRCDATGGAFTVTLPPALNLQGRRILLKKIDASGNAVTIAAAGSDTIEGSATKSLASQWDKYHLISNGVDAWEIV